MLAAAAGAGLLAAGSAGAATLPFSLGPTQGSANQTLTFDKFDPADGTLTGVQFSLASNTSIGATFQLTGAEGGTGGSNTTAGFTVLAPGDGGPLGVLFGGGVLQLGCTANRDVDLCTDSDTLTTLPDPFVSPFTLSDPLDLAFYEGAGTFDVEMTIFAITFLNPCVGFGPAAQCSIDVAVSWQGELAVTYLFEKPGNPPGGDVPEPGALLFLALGLPALARLRARA
jgi:hypothetical protein